jgi:hypothetical protein
MSALGFGLTRCHICDPMIGTCRASPEQRRMMIHKMEAADCQEVPKFCCPVGDSQCCLDEDDFSCRKEKEK